MPLKFLGLDQLLNDQKVSLLLNCNSLKNCVLLGCRPIEPIC